jgi:glutaredoxin
MKQAIRIFFKLIRILLTPFMHLWEFVTTPKGVVRAPDEQANINRQSQQMVLYQFKTCPFCIKVRREINRLSLPIELRDAQKNSQHRQALLTGGGQIKVPCLMVKDGLGNETWVYESAEINQYLHSRFAYL